MKRQTKLTSHEQEQAQEQQAAVQQTGQAAKEFGTVEELLRHDALHTPVPPRIEHRLQASTAQIQPPPRSWWKRMFGSET